MAATQRCGGDQIGARQIGDEAVQPPTSMNLSRHHRTQKQLAVHDIVTTAGNMRMETCEAESMISEREKGEVKPKEQVCANAPGESQ
ncbi:hypothetical protein VUR80DRAFT_10304 [Thermomyces stellatus]